MIRQIIPNSSFLIPNYYISLPQFLIPNSSFLIKTRTFAKNQEKMKKICDFIARWMGALVLLMALVALLIPAPFNSIDTWVINPMLGLIMFGMGLTLSIEDFKVVFSRPKDVLIGCLAQFTIMPLMAWVLTKVFGLSNELALGVILE